MTTLTEFGRYAETAENDQRLEIDHIQTYVMDELRRQNNIANDTKFICEKKLAELQNVLEDVSLVLHYVAISVLMVYRDRAQSTGLFPHLWWPGTVVQR